MSSEMADEIEQIHAEQSDTPLTDAEAFTEYWGAEHVPADFARDLERQNARLRQILAEFLDAGDNCLTAEDGVTAMIRFGEAGDAARAALAKDK